MIKYGKRTPDNFFCYFFAFHNKIFSNIYTK